MIETVLKSTNKRKKNGTKGFIILLLLLKTSLSMASLFPKGSHCVAYVAKKKLMLIRTVEVVGKNCQVSSQVVPDVGGVYSYKLEIPIDRFESGEEERDKDVRKILKSDKQDSLIFKTEKLKKEDWTKIILAKKEIHINGILNIGGKEYPIVASVLIIKNGENYEVDGLVKTKFKKLGVKAPQLFAGLMAKVKDEVELHFHLLSEKTLGFEALL
jgi:hypothetical protein